MSRSFRKMDENHGNSQDFEKFTEFTVNDKNHRIRGFHDFMNFKRP